IPDAFFAQLPAEIHFFVVQHRRKIQQSHIQVLHQAARGQNLFQVCLHQFRQALVRHAFFRQLRVGYQHPSHHQNARGNRGEFLIELGKFLARVDRLDQKRFQLAPRALRFGQRENSLWWLRYFLGIFVVFRHAFSVPRDYREFSRPIAYCKASMRSNATFANSRVCSSTEIWFTIFPAARFSSAHSRCCGVIRNIVVHTHTLGSSDITLRSFISLLSRFTKWISVPTAHSLPTGAASIAFTIPSVEPISSASCATSNRHSGCTITRIPGCCFRTFAMCSGVKRWCTEQ